MPDGCLLTTVLLAGAFAWTALRSRQSAVTAVQLVVAAVALVVSAVAGSVITVLFVTFTLLPAVDVADGRAVPARPGRCRHGDHIR